MNAYLAVYILIGIALVILTGIILFSFGALAIAPGILALTWITTGYKAMKEHIS